MTNNLDLNKEEWKVQKNRELKPRVFSNFLKERVRTLQKEVRI